VGDVELLCGESDVCYTRKRKPCSKQSKRKSLEIQDVDVGGV